PPGHVACPGPSYSGLSPGYAGPALRTGRPGHTEPRFPARYGACQPEQGTGTGSVGWPDVGGAMMNATDAQQGFTLIEVLVALTLMALISLISWRGLETVQHTGERLDERAEETLSLLRALSQIERDILLHAGPDVLPGLPVPDPRTARTRIQMPPGITWSTDTGL